MDGLNTSSGRPSCLFQTTRKRWIGDASRWQRKLDAQTLIEERRSRLVHSYAAALSEAPLKELPPVDSMKDLERSATRIAHAIRNQEPFAICGDYDVDGTSSCALLELFLAEYGIKPVIYIPDRLAEGYGLNPIAVQRLADQGIALIITVDNGISALEACALAKKRSVDVIITDHHNPPSALPEAYAIVNPKQSDCSFPYPDLAGVGVAFYLAIALRRHLQPLFPEIVPHLRSLLDLVAVGTIADVCPLTGLNHSLTKLGLEVLQSHCLLGTRPGLEALLTIAGVDPRHGIRAEQIAFQIGPRLNAAGRLGTAMKAYEIMATSDPQRAQSLAEELNTENLERRRLEREASAQIDTLMGDLEDGRRRCGIVLSNKDWHPGLLGIIASRCVERFYKPTLVLTEWEGVLKGSGRSTHEVDLYAALAPYREHFESFGGHAKAVGLSLSPQKLDWLRDIFKQALEPWEQHGMLLETSPLAIEGCLSVEDLDSSLARLLATLEPFGAENPRPRFALKDVEIKQVQPIGKNPEDGHCHVVLASRSGALSPRITAFSMRTELEKLKAYGQRIHAALEISEGFFAGRARLEVRLCDFGACENSADWPLESKKFEFSNGAVQTENVPEDSI